MSKIPENTKENLGMVYWAVLFTVFVEYMRLQEKYLLFRGIPFGDIAAGLLLIFFILAGRSFACRNRINGLILAFSVWMIITGLLGINQMHTFKVVIDIFKFFFVYFLTINVIENKRQLYWYIITILLMYFAHTNFYLRTWVSQGFYSGVHGTFVGSGFFHNANDFGAALSAFWGISLFMILGDQSKIIGNIKMKWFHIVNTLLFILAFLITSSRGASLAFVGSALYTVMNVKRRFFWLITLFMIGSIYITLMAPDQIDRFRNIGSEEDKTSQDRIETWEDAIHMFKDYPITGIGVGNFIEANHRIYGSNNPYVQHNIYLQALSETGLPGFIIVFFLIYSFFKNQREVKNRLRENDIEDPFFENLIKGLNVSMVGFLISGFFITVLFYPFLWFDLIISVALKKVVENEIRKKVNAI